MLDHSNEEELDQKYKDEPDKLLDFKRYAVINTGLAYVGNTAANVTPRLKQLLGTKAYSFQSKL